MVKVCGAIVAPLLVMLIVAPPETLAALFNVRVTEIGLPPMTNVVAAVKLAREYVGAYSQPSPSMLSTHVAACTVMKRTGASTGLQPIGP
jgi:hypothetical protein